MKTSNFKWLLGMCVPVVVFGGLAAYLSRAKPIAPPRDEGPFQLVVEGVRSIAATAHSASRGRDIAFELLLNSRGEKSEWWGRPIRGRTGNTADTTPAAPCRIVKIENGVAIPLKVDFVAWTTEWDGTLQRYTARLELDGSRIPRDKEVRWQGRIAIRDMNNPPTSPTLRYDVLLKKAGVRWKTPQLSRDSDLAIRRVEIVKLKPTQLEARITLFSPNSYAQSLQYLKLIDKKGHEIPFVTEWGDASALNTATGCCLPSTTKTGKLPSNRIGKGTISWNPQDVKPTISDVYLVASASASNHWPIEFSFPIKRNGKLLTGNVPVTSRPAPIQND